LRVETHPGWASSSQEVGVRLARRAGGVWTTRERPDRRAPDGLGTAVGGKGVSATAESAEGERLAGKLGFQQGQIVQELGFDDDCDDALRSAISSLTGSDLVDEDYDDVVDAVLLWWREDDGDLVDALMDARTRLDSGGSIWVLTPKAGRDRHVEPSDILEAAPTAGLTQTSSISVSKDWSGSRLVAPKTQRAARR
jgi:DUF3052 family protein